jgi:Rad3-related DNA helicase
MNDVVRLVREAFSENGPLHRLKGGDYRPLQAELAVRLAAFSTAARPIPTEPTGLQFQHAGTGLGKTMALGVCAGFLALETGERVIISTYTKALRDDLGAVSDDANAIIQETYQRLGLPIPRRVQFGVRKSKLDHVASSKIDWLRKVAQGKVPDCNPDGETLAHLNEFLSWAETSDSRLIADWHACEVSDGRNPIGLTDLELASGDKSDDDTDTDVDDDAGMAVEIVTHAKLIMNAASYGKSLGTTSKIDEKAKPQKRVVGIFVDEADALTSMATSMATRMVTLDEMKDAIRLCENAIPDDIYQIACRQFDDIRTTLHQIVADKNRAYLSDGDQQDKVVPSYMELWKTFDRIRKSLDPSSMASVTIHRIMYNMSYLVSMVNRSGSRTGRLAERTDGVLMIESRPARGLSLGIVPGPVCWLLSSLWHEGETTRFVSFLSGTLNGSKNDCSIFRQKIGRKNLVHNVDREETPLAAVGSKAGMIVFAERNEKIIPTLSEPTPEGSYLNKDHVVFCVDAILEASKKQKRILALFASLEAMEMAEKLLRSSGIADARLIVQKPGRTYTAYLTRYMEAPNGIWLGLNWEGINLVHPDTGETLVDTVMITKVPVPAGNQRRADTLGYYDMELRFEEAFCRTQQGIARGFRNLTDSSDIWVLDPRWPLPPRLSQKLKVAAALGSGDTNKWARFQNAIPPHLVNGGTLFGRAEMAYFYRDKTLKRASV